MWISSAAAWHVFDLPIPVPEIIIKCDIFVKMASWYIYEKKKKDMRDMRVSNLVAMGVTVEMPAFPLESV